MSLSDRYRLRPLMPTCFCSVPKMQSWEDGSVKKKKSKKQNGCVCSHYFQQPNENQQKNPHISHCICTLKSCSAMTNQIDSLCAGTKRQTKRSRRWIWKKFDTIYSKQRLCPTPSARRDVRGSSSSHAADIERQRDRVGEMRHTISNKDAKNSLGVAREKLTGKREKVWRFSGPSVSATPPEDTN